MDIRREIEEREEKFLSPYACLAKNSKGRKYKEDKCPMRTDFQRDRDRILHSKAFRRLKHKTQVYISPTSDHYRTRLTHTLEVSQIARTLARALTLNEDLVEAIALGHDLGHTPFGHIGEEALDKLSTHGFRHNIQSLRLVEDLELHNGKKGLNLTEEVRDGIRNHTGPDLPQTLEGMVVRLSDRIAYINHDIDDSIRAKLIKEEDLPDRTKEVLGSSHGERINTLIMDIIENSKDRDQVLQSPQVKEAADELRDFMFERVYFDDRVKEEADKAAYIIKELFDYYMDRPEILLSQALINPDEDIERGVCDYLAGMTDRYIMYVYTDVFMPRSWSIM